MDESDPKLVSVERKKHLLKAKILAKQLKARGRSTQEFACINREGSG
jgi:hypothetical protein